MSSKVILMIFKQLHQSIKKLKFLPHGVLMLSLLVACQVTEEGISEVDYARTQTDLSGLNGKWDIFYTIPDSRAYSLPLTVIIDGELLKDASESTRGDREQLLTDISIKGKWVKFRWQLIKPTKGQDVVIWDYKFTGEYRTDENKDRFLEGSVAGSEVDSTCLYPIAELKNTMRKEDGSCPSEQVSGTWKGRPL